MSALKSVMRFGNIPQRFWQQKKGSKMGKMMKRKSIIIQKIALTTVLLIALSLMPMTAFAETSESNSENASAVEQRGANPSADDERSLFGGAGGSAVAWSLFDLICTVLIVLGMLVGIVCFAFERKGEDAASVHYARARYNVNTMQYEYEEKVTQRRVPLLIASILLAIAAVLLFVSTQDMTQSMIFLDFWSIVFGIGVVLSVATLLIKRRQKKVLTRGR